MDEHLTLQLAAASTIMAYEFTSRGEGLGGTDSPHAWVLQGSTDGSAWIDLHTVNSEQAWGDTEVRKYYLPAAAAATYEYYRWLFPGSQKGSDGCGCQDSGGSNRYFVVLVEGRIFGVAA